MNWSFIGETALKLVLAMVSGGIIGFERGWHGRSAGLRTHILVCLGASLASILDLFASSTLLLGNDGTRIAAGVVTGIGFLGAGIILVKKDVKITGLTTAAGLWTTGIIGLAYGFGLYIPAVMATVLSLITTALLTKFEIKQKMDINLYIEIDSAAQANRVIESITALCGAYKELNVLSPKSQCPGYLGIRMVISKSHIKSNDIIDECLKIPNVVFAFKE